MVKVEMSEADWNSVLDMLYTFRMSPAALRIFTDIESQVK